MKNGPSHHAVCDQLKPFFLFLCLFRCASSATIFCSAGVKATNQLSTTVALADLNYHPVSEISYDKTSHSFDCIGEEYKLCWKSIELRFKNATNNFNLTTKDINNVSLAEAFCYKFINVTKSKLALGKSFECASPTNNYAESTYTNDIESSQSIECINGTAYVTDTDNVTNSSSKLNAILSITIICLILMSRSS